MPEFPTPDPIKALLELMVADVRITASDRSDTSVEVRPSDPGHDPDVRAAEQTRVELTPSGLLVKTPKQRGIATFSKPGSIDVTIGLPAGSALTVDSGMLSLRSAGPLGECHVKAGAGSIELERTGRAELSTGAGTITAGQVAGSADVTTGAGQVRLGSVDGTATVKNSNGDTWIGDAAGQVRVNTSNGSITVDQPGADVSARTANGSLRIGALLRGAAQLKTAFGEIEIGVAEGTAAMVDAHTRMGTVHNRLTASDRPGPADQVAEVHAQTSFGDIVIRRA